MVLDAGGSQPSTPMERNQLLFIPKSGRPMKSLESILTLTASLHPWKPISEQGHTQSVPRKQSASIKRTGADPIVGRRISRINEILWNGVGHFLRHASEHAYRRTANPCGYSSCFRTRP